MMSSENSVGRATSRAASKIVSHAARSCSCCWYASPAQWPNTCSTRITAPSTMMPKSTAPIDSRFADIPRDVQVDERRRERQRDHERDDQRRAHRQQEHEQHERDEQRALGEVVEHGVERGVDEIGAVVERRRSGCAARGGRTQTTWLPLVECERVAVVRSRGTARRSCTTRSRAASACGGPGASMHGPSNVPSGRDTERAFSSVYCITRFDLLVVRLLDERDLAVRQRVRVQLLQALAQRGEHDRRVLAAPHEHDALDGVVVVAARDDALARRVAGR